MLVANFSFKHLLPQYYNICPCAQILVLKIYIRFYFTIVTNIYTYTLNSSFFCTEKNSYTIAEITCENVGIHIVGN